MRDDVVGMEADKSEGVKITPLIPNMYESIRYLEETAYPTRKVEKGPICESVDINAEDGTPEIISDYYEPVISTVSRFSFTGFSDKYKAFLEAPNAYVNWDAIPSRTRIDAFFDDVSTYKEATETIEMDGNYPIGFKSNATTMTISSLLSRAVVYNTGSRFNLRPLQFISSLRGKATVCSISKLLTDTCSLSLSQTKDLFGTLTQTKAWTGTFNKDGVIKVAPPGERPIEGGKYKMGVLWTLEEGMYEALVDTLKCEIYTSRKNTCEGISDGKI